MGIKVVLIWGVLACVMWFKHVNNNPKRHEIHADNE